MYTANGAGVNGCTAFTYDTGVVNARADAWNGATLRETGSGTSRIEGTITYVVGAQTFTMPVGQNFPPEPGLYVASDFTPVPLPDIPANAMVTRVQLTSSGSFCHQPPAYILALSLNIPSSSGTPPPTNPPQTVAPTTTPTTPTTTPGGGGGTGTEPFSSPVNYLRSRYNTGLTNGACIATGSTSGAVSMVDCSSPNKALTFPKTSGNFQIKQTNNGQVCLQIGGSVTTTEFDGQAGRTALVAQWGDCQNTVNVPGQTFASFFNTGLVSGGGGIEPAWYFVAPQDNYPGWNNPCLSMNALAGTDTGTSGQPSATPVIQFTCQPVNGRYWQQWAPTESFAGTGNCGSTCPPGPPGATFLEEIKPTLLEAAGDLACIGGSSTPALFVVGSAECVTFLPDIAPTTTQGGRAAWYLVDTSNPDRCLGYAGTSLRWGLCDPSAVWLDFESPTPLAFSLRAQTNTNLCLSRQVALESCANVASQLWYDSNSVANLMKSMPTQLDPTWDARTQDAWRAVEADYPALSAAMTTYRYQAPSASRGQKAQTLPAVAVGNIVAELLREVMKYCDPRTRNCIGAAFASLNFVHWIVQGDIATKVGGERECLVLGGSGKKFDVVRGTCSNPNSAIEVKFDSAWGRTRGQIQLSDYIQTAAQYSQTVTVGAAPPFPSLGAISLLGFSTVHYNLLTTGVAVYRFDPRTVVPLLFSQLGIQTYREYARKVFPAHQFQPARNGLTIDAFLSAAKAVREAPEKIGEQILLQFTDLEIDGWVHRQWRVTDPVTQAEFVGLVGIVIVLAFIYKNTPV